MFFSSYRSGVVNVKQLVNCNIVSLESVFFRCLTYFLFYILLIWGGAYALNAPPLPTGLMT